MPTITALFRGERIVHHGSGRSAYVIGRDPQRCDVVLPPHWQVCARVQAVVFQRAGGWWVRDGDGVTPTTNGTYTEAGEAIGAGHRLKGDEVLWIGRQSEQRIQLCLEGFTDPEDATAPAAEAVTIGRGSECEVRIDDPYVSRLHALLKPEGNGIALIRDCSSNGLFIEGRRADRLSRIAPGVQLQVGRARLRWTGTAVEVLGDDEHYGIEIRSLMLPQRLQAIDLSISGGQLVALVGGSGAGKSSLLTTIAGQNSDYQGELRIGGGDLRRTIGAIRPLMGFVPQDDIVHQELTVREVLEFTARLRLPDRESRQRSVQRVLEVLEIAHRQQAQVRQLSGGQRKRVSIGVELIADPRLLLLDEPTSGLDPGLDRRMMRLLRTLADQGHTVVVVTHATANVHLCHQVVFLGAGGHLCYAGDPQGCLSHFGAVSDFAEIYERLDGDPQSVPAEALRFREGHPLPELLPLQGRSRDGIRRVSGGGLEALRRGLAQVATLVRRDVLIAWRDRPSLLMNLLLAPLAILLLAWALNKPEIFRVPSGGATFQSLPEAIKVIFVISCACIWTGMSSHLTSIAREKAIYERERSYNLMPVAYVSAKFALLALLALPQACLIALAASLCFRGPSDPNLGPPLLGYGITAFVTILASGALALLVSAVVKDQRQASSAFPILLMPQIIFSGVLFQGAVLEFIYAAVTSRWTARLFGAFSGLDRLAYAGALPASLGVKAVDPLPYASTLSNVSASLLILVAQVVVSAVLSFWVLSRPRGLR